MMLIYFFFFNDTATTEIYTLSLHDALPIFQAPQVGLRAIAPDDARRSKHHDGIADLFARSEEHTSELQSHLNLVCRLLLEKEKKRSTERLIKVLCPGTNKHGTLVVSLS